MAEKRRYEKPQILELSEYGLGFAAAQGDCVAGTIANPDDNNCGQSGTSASATCFLSGSGAGGFCADSGAGAQTFGCGAGTSPTGG